MKLTLWDRIKVSAQIFKGTLTCFCHPVGENRTWHLRFFPTWRVWFFLVISSSKRKLRLPGSTAARGSCCPCAGRPSFHECFHSFGLLLRLPPMFICIHQFFRTFSVLSWFSLPTFSVGKETACNGGDPGLIPGWGRSAGEGIGYPLQYSWASLAAQLVKNPPEVWKTWVWSLGWEDPLAKGKATHSFWPGEFH